LSKFDEEQLEQAGINWFKELDYTYMNGYEISPGGKYQERESHPTFSHRGLECERDAKKLKIS
jgi:hypothetical protein